MGLFKNEGQSKDDKKVAVAKYKGALKALHANQEREEKAGIRHETPEYRRLNKAADDAAKDVPWIRRLPESGQPTTSTHLCVPPVAAGGTRTPQPEGTQPIMSLFSSRMKSDELAKVKNNSGKANAAAKLAIAANGHGVTAAERRKAQAALVDAVGKRQAAKLQEAAIRQAGGKAKGLGRLFG
ncbi:hypothetical protein AB0B89_29205 [Sphaerisporangium sp. NPDC049002]|uniref:hypothetical protein n=1 Tax=Sphaerisporangium sp. NPDC049002 TaxID=3155392 RepID=UPI0033D19F1A